MSQDKIKAGVIGWPISHSLSPRLFSYWLKKYKINGLYNAYAVEEKELPGVLSNLRKEGLAGLNVTVPHKQTVMEYVDQLSERASKFGAVNTITLKKDGILIGDNTDGFGFIENLKQNYKGLNPFCGVSVVIGAGGAARSIVTTLITVGVKKIYLINRTRRNAEKLAEDIGGPISILDWSKRHESLADATFVVNTTTLGMNGKPPLDLTLEALPKKALVNDIVYTPLETQLLKNSKIRGNPTVDGIGMLLHQARPGFAAWFGKEPIVTKNLRNHVLALGGD
jgi:shikimate dehydrogenase